jgi:hypothetical protein
MDSVAFEGWEGNSGDARALSPGGFPCLDQGCSPGAVTATP